METYPKKVRLAGTHDLELRPADPDDKAALQAFFDAVPDEDRLFLREDVRDPAVIETWLADIDHTRVLPMLAFDEARVVGDATLHRQSRGWSRHVGEIRIVVAREWQHRGVAQALIRELVSEAVNSDLEILEAQVLEGQEGARRAFEALGFKVEATLHRRAKDLDGRIRDVLVLTHNVGELWQRMADMITDSEYNPAAG